MKKIIKLLFSAIALQGALFAADCCPKQKPCCNGPTTSNNTFLPRSFSSNSAREVLMTKSLYDEARNPKREAWHGTLTTATEFSATIHRCNANENLGTRPFWSGKNTMTYGTNDGLSDVDAYQFGMGDIASTGTIKLDPHVRQAGADMMLHFVQHVDKPGMYFKLRAPMVALQIDPRMSEPVEAFASDVNGVDIWSKYPASTNRPRTLAGAFAGGSLQPDISALSNASQAQFGREVVLEFGQVSICKMSAFRMADVSFAVGANLTSCDKGLVGLGFKVTAPTGNVANAEEILEPIVGRGGCWGLGLEMFGHRKMHEGDNGSSLHLRWQGELFHLAHGRTSFRSFDLLQNGPGSKYMLLEYYHQNVVDGEFSTAGFITQAINLTTLPVKSKFSVEGSMAIMVDGGLNNWEYGVGGEVWGRSCEKLSLDQCEMIKDHFTGEFNDFAVLGRQRSGGNGVIEDRCEPLARINKSEDYDSGDLDAETDKIKNAKLSANRIPASICEALDIGSAMAKRAITAKVFGNVGYCWKEANYKPHVSVYGSAEFSAGSDNNAMNLWAVGVQGSLNF